MRPFDPEKYSQAALFYQSVEDFGEGGRGQPGVGRSLDGSDRDPAAGDFDLAQGIAGHGLEDEDDDEDVDDEDDDHAYELVAESGEDTMPY